MRDGILLLCGYTQRILKYAQPPFYEAKYQSRFKISELVLVSNDCHDIISQQHRIYCIINNRYISKDFGNTGNFAVYIIVSIFQNLIVYLHYVSVLIVI